MQLRPAVSSRTVSSLQPGLLQLAAGNPHSACTDRGKLKEPGGSAFSGIQGILGGRRRACSARILRDLLFPYARTSAWQRRASKPSSMCSLARCRNRESMELFGVGAASAIARGAFQTPPPSRGRRPVICTVSGARFRNPGTLGTFVLCFLQNSEGTSRGNASIQNACGGRHVSALPLIGPGANGIRTTRHNS